MKRFSRTAVAVVVTLLLVLPFAGILGLTVWDRQNSLYPSTIETVPVRSATSASSDPVDIALGFTTIPPVFAPAWSGTVTAVPGQASWVSGELVVQVDRVWRIAFASDAPFTRPLGVGDTGSDVTALRALLTSLNLPSESTGALGRASLRGIRALASQLGVVGTVAAFDPSWVVFMPRSTIEASQSILQLGGPAPGQGTPIIPAGKQLTSGILVAFGQFGNLEPNTAPPAGAQAVNTSSLVPESAPAGSRLILGDQMLELDGDRVRLSDAGVSAIAGAVVPGAIYLNARLETPAQLGAFVVPAASIVFDPSGASCVFRDQPGEPPIAVTIVDNVDDAVEVLGDLSTSYRLLVDLPAARRSCG